MLAECQTLARAITSFRSLDALHASTEWANLGPRLTKLLAQPRLFAPAIPPAAGEQLDRLKAAHWNIEHGNRYPQVELALREHAELSDADVIFINEADLGMARSGNRDVLGDLSRALNRHAAWAPLFLETTTGRYEDLRRAEGHINAEGLFGLGIVSRWPLRDVRLIELPSPDVYQFNVERMFGHHIAMVATVDRPGASFVAVAVHLEVHRTRAHRATQMRVLLDSLVDDGQPVLIAGDFNSHTFDRGRMWDPWWGAAVLMFAPQRALEHRLLFPDQGRQRETLFDELTRAGFRWTKLVDRVPTLQLRFDRIDELRAFPDFVQHGVHGALAWAERRGKLRLDWFAARGFADGRGYTVRGLDGHGRASDHAPIVCELW